MMEIVTIILLGVVTIIILDNSVTIIITCWLFDMSPKRTRPHFDGSSSYIPDDHQLQISNDDHHDHHSNSIQQLTLTELQVANLASRPGQLSLDPLHLLDTKGQTTNVYGMYVIHMT